MPPGVQIQGSFDSEATESRLFLLSTFRYNKGRDSSASSGQKPWRLAGFGRADLPCGHFQHRAEVHTLGAAGEGKKKVSNRHKKGG